MKNFDTRTYSINDFREWSERDQLVLAPKFQRRNVWSDKARSFLMDTIIRGKPIPKIFLRQTTDATTKKTFREVVDGQQRLRTILSFLADGFTISRVHNDTLGGLPFSELDEGVQKAILNYEIAVDLLLDAPDSEVLDIFGRLNAYAVILSAQEKLHAKYFGEFKIVVYRLALEFLSFWQHNRILSDKSILRMSEAELVSELLITMSDGIHSKKAIESFYKKYDPSFPRAERFESRFRTIMDLIGSIYNGDMTDSEFRRPHMFYTLFSSLYHMQYGVPNLKVDRKRISPSELPRVRVALESVDITFQKDDSDRTPHERRFMEATRRATTDASTRVFRTEFVCKRLLRANSYHSTHK